MATKIEKKFIVDDGADRLSVEPYRDGAFVARAEINGGEFVLLTSEDVDALVEFLSEV